MSNTEKTMVILWIAISFILSASGQTNYTVSYTHLTLPTTPYV